MITIRKSILIWLKLGDWRRVWGDGGGCDGMSSVRDRARPAVAVACELALELLDSVLETFDVVDERLEMLLSASLLGGLPSPGTLMEMTQ